MNETVQVGFCCNDERGEFSGLLAKVDVGGPEELLSLEGPMEAIPGDKPDWQATTRIKIGKHPSELSRQWYIRIEDESMIGTPWPGGEGKTVTGYWQEFFLETYGTWVGSMAWDGATMRPEALAAMLNCLRKVGFTVEVGESELFRKWNSEEPFTAQDFGDPSASEPPYVCPNTVPLPL